MLFEAEEDQCGQHRLLCSSYSNQRAVGMALPSEKVPFALSTVLGKLQEFWLHR